MTEVIAAPGKLRGTRLYHFEPAAQVAHRPPRKGNASKPDIVDVVMLADVRKLGQWRFQNGEINDFKTWAYVIAAVLARAQPGRYRLHKPRRWLEQPWRTWPGLTEESLSSELQRAAVEFEGENLARIIEEANARNKRIFGPEIGKLLKLQPLEREEVKCWRLQAGGETSRTRRNRRRAKKRAAEAEGRKRKGARPHCESLMQLKPWEAEGISRATWYRQGRHKTLSLSCQAAGDSCQAHDETDSA
jgi:hypothetical protein